MADIDMILPDGEDIVGKTLEAFAPEATRMLEELGGIPPRGQAIVSVTMLVWREGRKNRASVELTVSRPPVGREEG